jgi:hypothetical protein
MLNTVVWNITLCPKPQNRIQPRQMPLKTVYHGEIGDSDVGARRSSLLLMRGMALDEMRYVATMPYLLYLEGNHYNFFQ